MKKFLILIAVFGSFAASSALAHGGVAKNIGNFVVYLNQNPLSPKVDEPIKFSFQIVDAAGDPLVNQPVRVNIVDTFFGDATQDKIIEIKNFSTDVNGAFEFDYSFGQENYFDLDLDFKDPATGEELSTGFLVQPIAIEMDFISPQSLLILSAGMLLGVVLTQITSLKKTSV